MCLEGQSVSPLCVCLCVHDTIRCQRIFRLTNLPHQSPLSLVTAVVTTDLQRRHLNLEIKLWKKLIRLSCFESCSSPVLVSSNSFAIDLIFRCIRQLFPVGEEPLKPYCVPSAQEQTAKEQRWHLDSERFVAFCWFRGQYSLTYVSGDQKMDLKQIKYWGGASCLHPKANTWFLHPPKWQNK